MIQRKEVVGVCAEAIAEKLAASDDPIIAYKARTGLCGANPAGGKMLHLREKIREGETARRLLSGRGPDGTIPTNPYRKWQGPHWTLYSLAQIDYPPGDDALLPLRELSYGWLLAPEHLRPPRTLAIPGQEERVRRCASQEGSAIWYSLVLGFADARTKLLVDRLIELQWPDGGWNCDKRPEAHRSSIIETLIPLRALMLYGRAYDYAPAIKCADRSAEFLLARRLLYRLHDGELIRPRWGGDIAKIHYPIQFYDVLFALLVMCEIGRIADERCAPALELLVSKRLADGGFPVEEPNCTTSERLVTRGSFARWGPTGRRSSNPYVTIQALEVLQAAGRLTETPTPDAQ